MLKGKKGKKGFTLLELVIAIGLLALFAVFIGVSLNRTFKKQKENDYNNNLSLLGVKLSKLIENGFNKIMWLILNELESVIDS